MTRQNQNPGYLFWLHTLIGVPFGAFAITWAIGAFVGSDTVILGAWGLMLVGAAAVIWRLPRVREMARADRWFWAIVGPAIAAGASVAWVVVALAVTFQTTCGSGCNFNH
jgi:hypothetical protein